jgi:hypothetical protein
MKLNLILEFPSSLFSYDPVDKEFRAEASDLGNRHLQRFYDDACDVGFSIKSSRTGNVVDYVMTDVTYHLDGEDREIFCWKYTPSAESERKFPSCKGTKALIWND